MASCRVPCNRGLVTEFGGCSMPMDRLATREIFFFFAKACLPDNLVSIVSWQGDTGIGNKKQASPRPIHVTNPSRLS